MVRVGVAVWAGVRVRGVGRLLVHLPETNPILFAPVA